MWAIRYQVGVLIVHSLSFLNRLNQRKYVTCVGNITRSRSLKSS